MINRDRTVIESLGLDPAIADELKMSPYYYKKILDQNQKEMKKFIKDKLKPLISLGTKTFQ